MPDDILLARGITKRFPGVVALDRVSLTVRSHEVHALMGENGAGKSTLFKVLTGAEKWDEGELSLGGARIRPGSPREAEAAGISTVYQEVNLCPHLTIAENILLGRHPRRFGLIDRRASKARARAALARLGLAVDVDRPLHHYSIAVQQMCALARALDVRARVLILDEPTASLDRREVEELFHVLRRLRDDGLAIVFVSHFLDQVYELADRITVLRQGRNVGEFMTRALSRMRLIEAMTGRGLESGGAVKSTERRKRGSSPAILEFRDAARHNAVGPLNFSVGPGELVGLAGLLGSGRTETARLAFGLDRLHVGETWIDGEPRTLSGPAAALRIGFALTVEDRKTAGIVPHLSVRENIVLALQASRGPWRLLDAGAQRTLAQHFISALAIRTPTPETPVRNLSGGNQQKVILARWLATKPRLLILDEPTRGIDIGAKADVETLLAKLRDDGLAVVFISSEIEEVARLSERVIVLRDREQVGELLSPRINTEEILRMIAGEPGRARMAS
jgi:galactofuranose transport system ATP-binding protein